MTEGRRDGNREAEQLAVAEEVLSLLRHDVRNKLSSARQAAHYLKTRAERSELWSTDARVPRFFGIVDEQLVIADELLSRHEAMESIYARAPGEVDPAQVVAAAVAGAARQAQVRVVTSVSPGVVHGDREEIALALRCLIENAFDASPEGGTVTIEGAADGEGYAFVVHDDGPGLDVETFRQMSRPLATTRPGRRGLGLSIARRVAHRWGGAVTNLGGERGAHLQMTLGMERST